MGMHSDHHRILLDGQHGESPSDEELSLLIQGLLQDKRREEVLTHLALDPELNEQWCVLCSLLENDREMHGAYPALPSRQFLAEIDAEIQTRLAAFSGDKDARRGAGG